ncbi:MAG: hypothetical protein ABEJ43_10205 [Haloferacaceae archaeon]
MDLSTRTLAGIVLIVVGSVLFVPAIGPQALGWAALVPAALALTAGTYLVGTDVSGRAV